MNTEELIEALRAQADFIDADTYDECWEVKETPRGKTLRAAASRLSEMEGAIQKIKNHLSDYIETRKTVDVSVAVAFETARAALEQQP